jgi:hypothetical protein
MKLGDPMKTVKALIGDNVLKPTVAARERYAGCDPPTLLPR